MQWHQVHLFPLNIDLSPLLKELKQRYVVHRVTEEVKGQRLWVADDANVAPLREFIESGGLDRLQAVGEGAGVTDSATGSSLLLRVLQVWNQYPVTLLTIYLGALGALLVAWDHEFRWVSLFTFTPVEVSGQRLQLFGLHQSFEAGQWWRLVSPVFLHFGLFHILFNGLWVWEFGRRIELVFGSGKLIAMLLSLALFSNCAQYLWSGPALFGGLSGVLYGLLGFLWIFNLIRPHPSLAIAKGIIGFMLAWMLLCMSGIVNAFMAGSIANGAHFGGLVGGMALGFIGAKLARK